jgi:ArsR family transcriptional regulator, virulence genes transcriptional regulator
MTNLLELENNADAVARRLKLMANTARVRMLCRLVESEVSVTELVELTGLSQSSVSQHLALLRKAGVVSARREAQTRFYRTDDPLIRSLVHALCEDLTDVSSSLIEEGSGHRLSRAHRGK